MNLRNMSLPFLKHLEWLCLEGLEISDIQKFYDNIQLPIPTEKDIEYAKDRVSKLPLSSVHRKRLERGIFKEEDTFIFEKLGYGDLFKWRCGKENPDWACVGKALNHPLMRTSLDVCIITNVETEKIAMMLPQVYGIKFTEAAVELYRKYFGFFEVFGRSDWKEYLERLREDQYVFVRIFAALTKPKEEVLHMCGLPSEQQFSVFLKNVLATASYKFGYYSRQNTTEGDINAMDWAKVGIVAGEKFEKYGAGDASDFAKLVQTEFQYVTPEIDTLSPELALELRPKQGE